MKKTPAKFTESEALFLPLVSHDIKSLTRAIAGASQALSSKFVGSGMKDEQSIREFVQLIGSASSTLMPLIEDLVAIGKAQANSDLIAPRAVFNLAEELECARDTFAYEALAKQITLTYTQSADIPVVYCDIERLRTHVINNLLSNAIRFTPVGGKIAMRVEKPDDSTMVIKISDSGLGIPQSERERVFRLFVRSEQYRNVTGSKRGVGLFNAQRCVAAHQGKISVVDDAEFSGATFRIELPLFSACIQ